MTENYIIGNGIITDGFSFLLEDGAIEVENGRIKQIGKTDELKSENVEFFDLQNRLVLPGLLNPHHHLYSALATGISPIGETDNFTKVLKNLWWHLDQNLDEESIYYSALYGLINSVKYGVTTIFDHHASMNYISGSLQLIEKAFKEIGVKGLLCYEISDRIGEKAVPQQLDENIRFWESHKGNPNIWGLLGLHANFTLSEETLALIKQRKPADLSIHIHCGEDKADMQYCTDNGYKGPVHRLHEYGLLSPNSLLAHCIHLSPKDYDIIRKIQPVIISNPESNANNNVGEMDLSKIEKYCLGTDGMTGNILGTMRSHFLRQNGKISQPLDILFQYPGNILKRFFPDSGALEVGKTADLAVTDYIPVTGINLDNLFYHLIFGVEGQKMYMTISDGKILYKDGKIQTIDEEEIIAKVKQAAQKLHKKYYE
ncbi:MAG: amidohydrolase family protein [Candidatus Marinimicrobia bacterium]|nr:amidohydrolase family protein [Candidatus Neomarinimicrobiota bacterium]